MSNTARKFLISALIYLIFGLLIQVVILFDVWLGFNPLTFSSVNAARQTLFFGWLTQAALALIYQRWLPQNRYGRAVFWLFNLALPLTIIGQPALALLGQHWIGLLVALSGLIQLAAGLLVCWEARLIFRSNQ